MRRILNIVWVPFAGAWLSLVWLLVSLLLAVTIVGLPFARQTLRIAEFALWPFGRAIVHVDESDGSARTLSGAGNLVWGVLIGWWLALAHVMVAMICILSIFGVPFAIGIFKLLPASFAPFGRRIVPVDEAPADAAGAITIPTTLVDEGHPVRV